MSAEQDRKTRDEMSNSNKNDSYVLFEASPSLWALVGTYVESAIFLAIAIILMLHPVSKLAAYKIIPVVAVEKIQIGDTIAKYGGMGLAGIVVVNVLYQTIRLKRIRYEVNPDRIEFTRGVFSRKIDNLDMFRVVDIKLHRSLLDCITGVGSVTLVTKDESDPVFEFEKVANPKALYDVIKKASLDADRRQGVIHID